MDVISGRHEMYDHLVQINAAKYTPPRGAIAIDVQRHGAQRNGARSGAAE